MGPFRCLAMCNWAMFATLSHLGLPFRTFHIAVGRLDALEIVFFAVQQGDDVSVLLNGS